MARMPGGNRDMLAIIFERTFLCESITPLGVPVVPDVYIMVARSSYLILAAAFFTCSFSCGVLRAKISFQCFALGTCSNVYISFREGTWSFTLRTFKKSS